MQTAAFRACLVVVWAILVVSPCRGQSQPRNPNADWFQKAGYGVFVHYLSGLQNNPEAINGLGRETSWEECVGEFDTEHFDETMEEVGGCRSPSWRCMNRK